MPRQPAILSRFRRLMASPGPPAASLGVPAAGSDLEAELGPLFGELDAVGAEAARIGEDAVDEVARRRERSVEAATAIIQEARGQAAAARERAATSSEAAHLRELAAARGQSARAAPDLGRDVDARVGGLVGEVIASVRAAGH